MRTLSQRLARWIGGAAVLCAAGEIATSPHPAEAALTWAVLGLILCAGLWLAVENHP